MELTVSEAKPRLSELIAAAQRGERVVITKRGEPAVELVACAKPDGGTHGRGPSAEQKPQGDFFERLAAARKRLGIEDIPPEEAKAFAEAIHDSTLSCRLLGVDTE